MMEEYRKAIENCARLHLDNMVHNEGNEHALIIFENLLKYSKKHVRIAAGDMSNLEVVNTKEYIQAMVTFLENPGAKLDVLLTNFNDKVEDIDRNINLFYMLYQSKAYREDRINIKQANGKYFQSDGKPVHFCTSDGHAYRVERDIENRVAHGNFGDTTKTKAMEELFDSIFNSNKVGEVDLTPLFKKQSC